MKSKSHKKDSKQPRSDVGKTKYDHKDVEPKWRKMWTESATNYPKDIGASQKKFYNLWMFPYPSAEGLHAGHVFASTGSDVIGRYMRMKGYEVFQPIGYDSFGIHSENYAIKVNMTPQEMLAKTTQHYADQMKSLGHGYDWMRTVTTSDPDYYKWTQWLFLQMFKAGLAYRKSAQVNWCPSCMTVLADEQVMSPQKAGKIPPGFNSYDEIPETVNVCERCGNIVEKKELEQWFFRITKYADKLLENLGKIDWPEKIKIAQNNWIGKKEGINITYKVEGSDKEITVWTSRPDTNFGATFIVIAPENPVCLQITTSENHDNVRKYIESAFKKSYEERNTEGKQKTGAFTGSYAINNLNGYKMPIYVADFVLPGVGTGAVVGVPGHDRRDFEFANAYDLPIVRVVVGKDGDSGEISRIEQVQEEDGVIVNSDFLNGLDVQEALQKMIVYLEDKGWGKRKSNYHLRDWLISRQRYWGPPIPMIYCKNCADNQKSWLDANKEELLVTDQTDWSHNGWYPLSEADLPLELPVINDYLPDGSGKGPLEKHPEFYVTRCPGCGSEAKRETDVSDTFLDSSWYFLRYPSVGSDNSNKMPYDIDITNKWLPVDLYFGGAEHAVLHLMYARFVSIFLHELGKLAFEESLPRFFAHGLMIKDGAKMSKSRGNVVNPDEYIEKYGADTLRLYVMFIGPMDGYPDFRDTGIEGMHRFVGKLWRLFKNFNIKNVSDENIKQLDIKMHQTIKKVSEDIQDFHYNTAIAAIMEYANELAKYCDNIDRVSDKDSNYLINLAQLIAPFAPHLAEEVWVNVLGQEFSIHRSKWPTYDEKLVIEQTITIPIQVNGKLRGQITIARDLALNKEEIFKLAKDNPKVAKWLGGEIKKEIYIEGKLVNFVV